MAFPRIWRRPEAAAPPAAGSDPADLVRRSGLFDAAWYREAHPDAAEGGADPLAHFLEAGHPGERDPNPFFDAAWYLEAYPDVREAGLNPLVHYIATGAAEGRRTGPLFDTAYYCAENPDVEAAGLNPLWHFLHHGRAEGRLGTPIDEVEAFEAGVRAKARGAGGAATSLFTGARADRIFFSLPERAEAPAGALPLPPLRLAQRIGSVSLADFDSSGAATRDTILRALPPGYDWRGRRCLDFGSGVGRTLRHFGPEAGQGEFWGCDIDGSSVRWCVRNLSPPFRFFQIGEVPTLPFEDDSFDLVYAISVMSHIHTTWHQWLMEFRRILKPDGHLFISFMGPTPMEAMLSEPYWGRDDGFGMIVKGPHHNWNEGGPMIFVSPDWLKCFWGSLFHIDYIAVDGLMEDQSFCLMRKPGRGEPPRTDARVLELSTTQPFDRDAVGRIDPQFDRRLPYLDSYGLDLRAERDVPVSGWIAFRGSEAEGVEVLVDGRGVPAEVALSAGAPFRDWPGAPQTAFAMRVDLSAVGPGEHRLEARVRSRAGRAHALTISLLIR